MPLTNQIRSKSVNKENNSNSNHRESQVGSTIAKLNMNSKLVDEEKNNKINEPQDNEEEKQSMSTLKRLTCCCCLWSYHHTVKIGRQSMKNRRHGDGDDVGNQREAFNSLLYQLRIQTNTTGGGAGVVPGGGGGTATTVNSSGRRRRAAAALLGKRRAASAQIDRICSNVNQKHIRNVEAINNLIESRRRVVRLSIILVLLFLFSWLPYHIVSLTIDTLYYWERLDTVSANQIAGGNGAATDPTLAYSSNNVSAISSQHISIYIYPIVLCLALANSVTNPVCYITLSHGFRVMFKNSFNRIVNFIF